MKELPRISVERLGMTSIATDREIRSANSVAAPQTVFLCGGQGSQYFGMGRALYFQEPVFRDELHWMDSVAREMLGISVVDT